MPRTTVLLGAGASADAGLPLTVRLAETIVRRANSGAEARPSAWVSALNFVYGSMIGHQAEDGGNPLQAVNIERLISALRLLADAANHEAAPFVIWKPGVTGATSATVDRRLGEAVIRSLGRALGERSAIFEEQEVADKIAAIARAATRSHNTSHFREAERHVRDELADILGKPSSVGYLAPLAELAKSQHGGLDVITLNYDLTVEMMANEQSIPVHRGMENLTRDDVDDTLVGWGLGRPMSWPRSDGAINLYKLHGSLDWALVEEGTHTRSPRIEVRSVGQIDPYSGRLRSPWIVVGDREKLATDGPTLRLFRAAEEALEATTHLVVVGYSFSDKHINGLIRDWLASDNRRTITVLDLGWLEVRDAGFQGALVAAYGGNKEVGRESRLTPVVGRTAERLATALEKRPPRYSDVTIELDFEVLTDGCVRYCAIVRGTDFSGASASVRIGNDDDVRAWRGIDTMLSPERLPQLSPYGGSVRYAQKDEWTDGEEFIFYSRVPDEQNVTVKFLGRRLDEAYGSQYAVAARFPSSAALDDADAS